MAEARNYSIRKNRISSGLLDHAAAEGTDILTFDSESGSGNVFLKAIDSGTEGSEWGRFCFKCVSDDNVVVITRIGASDNRDYFDTARNAVRSVDELLTDPEESIIRKKEFFEKLGAEKYVDTDDCLLYSLQGRYLWIYMEVLGEGSCSISGMRVNMHGDNFMQTFPEIYQERNSFFHRYMSVFSSIFNDFQLEVDGMYEKIDADHAPRELLPVFASWLGIDTGNDLFNEGQLRTIVKEGYQLCKYKGTRETMERICEIVLSQKVILIEKNALDRGILFEERETYDRLFGESPYDITILVKGRENREKRAQLMFLLNQFKPLRTRINLVFVSNRNKLDSYIFMDDNALIQGETDASLDNAQRLDGTEVLK